MLVRKSFPHAHAAESQLRIPLMGFVCTNVTWDSSQSSSRSDLRKRCHTCPDRPTKNSNTQLAAWEEDVWPALRKSVSILFLPSQSCDITMATQQLCLQGLSRNKTRFFICLSFSPQRNPRSARGTELFEHKNKVTLMSANLRFSVACAVSNVRGRPHSRAPRPVRRYRGDESSRLEHTGQQGGGRAASCDALGITANWSFLWPLEERGLKGCEEHQCKG